MQTWVPGQMGGTETYARALLAALADRRDVAVTALVPADLADALPEGIRIVTGRRSDAVGGRLGQLGLALAKGRRIGRSTGPAAVAHYPFTVLAPRLPVPMIPTLHDVQHLDLPELFSRPEREYRRLFYDRASRHAPVVITVSEFCAQRIADRLGIAADRIVVAPLGVDSDRFSPDGGRREGFVLYPATAWPHKNHRVLIEAVGRLRASRPDLRLVLTGGRREELGPLPEWVEHRGYVTEQELTSLYRRAGCLGFPSRYEGFGLPVLEAMATGCPVASSDAGSLAEVVGPTAAVFSPDSVEGAARALETALGFGARHLEEGRRWASSFTWSRCADRHVEAYRRAAGQARPSDSR